MYVSQESTAKSLRARMATHLSHPSGRARTSRSLRKLAEWGRTAAGPPLLKLPLLPETQGLVHLRAPLFCPKINESQKPNITQMMLRVR